MIAANLRSVRQRIAISCKKSGRDPEGITLVCVTKTASPDEIREAAGAGAHVLGENRVQEAARKAPLVGAGLTWHLIGHLQTNKARDAVRLFSLIHSVDSIRLAEAIDKEASKAGTIQDILVQVNVAGEEAKFGVAPAAAGELTRAAQALPHLRMRGFMTIAPFVDDPETVRPVFRALRELRDELRTSLSTKYQVLRTDTEPWELSMGMTDDFEVAIEEGATIVRIGRAIFQS